jgi:hypothetical protein
MEAVYEHKPGTVVLNHGDPLASTASAGRNDARLAREIFLRIIAYVPFAETIEIPSRYILDGAAMYQATTWAAPLLEAGIVQPERRAELASFAELADAHQVGPEERARARELDRIATVVRPVNWKPLEATWRELIIQNLQPDGGFRNMLTARGFGAKRGRHAAALDRLAERHAAEGHGLEDFLTTVRAVTPGPVERYAARWAMARYYYTPTLLDPISVREIRAYAGSLLVRPGTPEPTAHEIDAPAPVAQAHARLTVELPLYGDIAERTQAYCAAALRVREGLPRARQVFTARSTQRDLDDYVRSASQALEDEARRQMNPRGRLHPWGARLGIGLVSGAVGFALGLIDPYAGAGSGLALSAGADKVRDDLGRRRRSWALAIDRLSEYSRPQRRRIPQPRAAILSAS